MKVFSIAIVAAAVAFVFLQCNWVCYGSGVAFRSETVDTVEHDCFNSNWACVNLFSPIRKTPFFQFLLLTIRSLIPSAMFTQREVSFQTKNKFGKILVDRLKVLLRISRKTVTVTPNIQLCRWFTRHFLTNIFIFLQFNPFNLYRCSLLHKSWQYYAVL